MNVIWNAQVLNENGYLGKHENKIGLFGNYFTPLCIVQKQEKKSWSTHDLQLASSIHTYLKDMSYTQVQYSEKQGFFSFNSSKFTCPS